MFADPRAPTSLYASSPNEESAKNFGALRKREVCCVVPSGVPEEGRQKKMG